MPTMAAEDAPICNSGAELVAGDSQAAQPEPIPPGCTDGEESAGSAGDEDRAAAAERSACAGPPSDAGFAAAADPFGAASRRATEVQSAAKLLKMGQRALSEGNPATARAYFHKAMVVNPDDPQIPAQAAVAALGSNDPNSAIDVLEKALQAFPKSASLHRILAAAHYRRGDFRSSQVAAQQALSLDNANALSYFLVGSALSRLGQPEAAEKHLRQARRLDPRYGASR